MSEPRQISGERLAEFLELLPEFFAELRARDYGIGTRQHIAVSELIGSLVARGALPATLHALWPWLAPLVCSSPGQQAEFAEHFKNWLADKSLEEAGGTPALPAPPPIPLPLPAPPTPTEPPQRSLLSRITDRRWPLLVAASLLLGLTVLFVVLDRIPRREGAQDQPVTPTPSPSVSPSPSPIQAVTPTPVETPGGSGATTQTPSPTPPPPASAPVVGQAWDVNNPPVVSVSAPPPMPLPTPTPAGFVIENFDAILAGAAALPLVALGGWGLWNYLRCRAQARRWKSQERRQLDRIRVSGARERVFGGPELRRLARDMRRHRSVASVEIDARATVHATARRGGLFTPVPAARRALPEYLVLIDRVGFGDQLAHLNTDIVRQLRENDVYVDLYYFHGDPNRCRGEAPGASDVALQDLAGLHPDHYLIVFSDGTGFVGPLDGRPQGWLEQLSHWRGRVMLTPIPLLEWSHREQMLGMRSPLMLLPSSPDGMRALGETIQTGGPPRAVEFEGAPQYPLLLQEDVELWKERQEPPPKVLRRLRMQLRHYLGQDGYGLLCACAMPPLLQWEVTLYLAYGMLRRGEVERRLAALVRLPWFRYGVMPDWLRQVLIGDLGATRWRAVRELVERLLLTFLENPREGFSLRAAPASEAEPFGEAPSPGPLQRIRAWRHRRRLLHIVGTAPEHSPVLDPVFLEFLTGKPRHPKLAERLRPLFRRGDPAFGLRFVPGLLLAAATALTLTAVLLFARPVDIVTREGVFDDLCGLMCPREFAKQPDADFRYTPLGGQRGQTYTFEVWVAPGRDYDFDGMTLRPPDGSGLTVSGVSATRDRLTVTVTVNGDAAPGLVNLALLERGQPRSYLPFTVSDEVSCPIISVRCVYAGGADRDLYNCTASVAGARPNANLSYRWVPGSRVLLDTLEQGTPSVVLQVRDVPPGSEGLRGTLIVGGLPAGCPTTVDWQAVPRQSDIGESELWVSTDPKTVNICPSDPMPDTASRANVTVYVRPTKIFTQVTKVDVTGGTYRYSNNNEPGNYVWNLSDVPEGSYTVTINARTYSHTLTGSDMVTVTRRCAPPPTPDPAATLTPVPTPPTTPIPTPTPLPSIPRDAVAVSPDGKVYALVSDSAVDIVDRATGAKVERLLGHTGNILAVVFSPDGSRIATSSTDRTVKVWNFPSGVLRFSLSLADAAADIQFSRDSRQLRTRSASGVTNMWDANDGRHLSVSRPPGGPKATARCGADRTVTCNAPRCDCRDGIGCIGYDERGNRIESETSLCPPN